MSLSDDGEIMPKTKMERLNSVILSSILRGCLYGALISIPTELLIRWRSPMFRWFGLRGRIFYHTIWVAAGANFLTEKEILKFETQIQKEKAAKRDQLIEASISSGNYLDFDDGESIVVNHRGGKKARSDVEAVRLDRDEIAGRGGGK